MAPASTRRAFRLVAGLFAAGAVLSFVLFGRALTEREIRTGLLTYGLLCAVTAFGLWRVRRWGRSMALVMSMGNAGLGTLTLLSVLIARRGPLLGPVTLLVVSLALSFILSRPEFNLPEDAMGIAHDD